MEELQAIPTHRRKNPQIIIGGNVELLNQALLIPWSTGGSAARGSYWKTVRDSRTNEELRLDLRVGDMKCPRAEAAIFAWDFLKPETLLDLKRDLDILQNKNIPIIFVCCNGEYTQEALETINRYTQESGVEKFIITNAEPKKFQGFRELDQKISEALGVKIGQNILFISHKDVYEKFRAKEDKENSEDKWESLKLQRAKKEAVKVIADTAPVESDSASKKEDDGPLVIPIVDLFIATTYGFDRSEDEIIGNVLWYKQVRDRSSKEILALAKARRISIEEILNRAETDLGITDQVPHPVFGARVSTPLNAIERKLLQAQIVIIDRWNFKYFFRHLDEQTQQNFKAVIKTKYVIIVHGEKSIDKAIKISDTLGLQEDMREFRDLSAEDSPQALFMSIRKVAAMVQNNSVETQLQPIHKQNSPENLLPMVIIKVQEFNQVYDPMDEAAKEKIKTELASKFVVIESDYIEYAQALAEKLELQRDRTQLRIEFLPNEFRVKPYGDFTDDDGNPISAAQAVVIRDAKREASKRAAEEFARQEAAQAERARLAAQEAYRQSLSDEMTRQKIVRQNNAAGTKKSKRASTSSAQYLKTHGMHRSRKLHAVLGGAMMTTSALGGAALAAAVMKGMVTLTVITSIASVGVGVAALLLLALFVWGLQKLISNTCCGSSSQRSQSVPLRTVISN